MEGFVRCVRRANWQGSKCHVWYDGSRIAWIQQVRSPRLCSIQPPLPHVQKNAGQKPAPNDVWPVGNRDFEVTHGELNGVDVFVSIPGINQTYLGVLRQQRQPFVIELVAVLAAHRVRWVRKRRNSSLVAKRRVGKRIRVFWFS